MAPLAPPSAPGRVNGLGFDATIGDEVPLVPDEAVLPDVKRLAYFEMAAAAVWAVEEDEAVVDEDES
jgi:hypothetical protein